jgi:hypothetical protein
VISINTRKKELIGNLSRNKTMYVEHSDANLEALIGEQYVFVS